MSEQRPEPISVVKKLIAERYSNACTVVWCGSLARGEGTAASDIDLVVIFDQLPNAYREAFMYEGWPVDVFANDPDTLRYFLHDSWQNHGLSGLAHMIALGREMTDQSEFSESIKKMAQDMLQSGPRAWTQQEIDSARFGITDALGDIVTPKSRDAQIGVAARLYEDLSVFYFRAQGKWRASGKVIVDYFKRENSDLAREYSVAFEDVFKSGATEKLQKLVEKILAPYGGALWAGFRSDASPACKREKQ